MNAIRTPARSGSARERGSITAFVIIMAGAFTAAAGLVIDGGLALAAKTAAIDEAQQAARTAAADLTLNALRTGTIQLDTARAATDAQAYITQTGDSGTIAINGPDITATVTHHQRTQILALLGLGEITVTGHATARVETGINQPDSATGP